MSRTDRPTAETSIRMRLSVDMRELIDRAAAILGKSRAEFVIESAHRRAIEMLIDQRLFHLDTQASGALAQILENPPAPVEALRRLAVSEGPWA